MGLILTHMSMLNSFQNCGWQGALPQTVKLARQGMSDAARRDFQMDSK